MAKTYDAVLKHLVEAYPSAWLAGAGWPTTGPVRVIDADVSTVTAGADKVFRVEESPPWVGHLELQAGPDVELADRAHLYNVLLRRRHQVPVRSAIVLLRRAADSPRLTGLLEHFDPSGDWERRWRYRVVRVWHLSADELLKGDLGLLPLAPLTDDAAPRLEEVVSRLDERLQTEAPRDRAEMDAIAFLLMGLCYPRGMAEQVWRGVRMIEQSSTYQWLMEKGMREGMQKGMQKGVKQGVKEGRKAELTATLLEIGTLRFGAPDPAASAALDAVSSLARLTRMRRRLLEAADWADLLATP